MEKTNHPLISVIIPTYNRRHELEKLLLSLNRQTLPPSQCEIIIVDDGSEDGTQEWLTNNLDQFKVKTWFYTQAHGGPGAARNLGMEKAQGNIFAFIDTDCIAEHTWLEHLAAPFHSEKTGAVGGKEITDDKDPLFMRCIHYLMTSPLTTGGLRGKRGRKLAQFYPRTFNMAISRKAYQATKGFKSMFHAEDIELSYRIKQKGFNLIYHDSARVYHRRRDTPGKFLRQVYHMGKARITLARMHPASLELLHIIPSLTLFFTLLLILSSFFWHLALPILKLYLGLGALYLIAAGTHSAIKLNSLKAFFLVPIFFILQQGAYGSGSLISLIMHEERNPD